ALTSTSTSHFKGTRWRSAATAARTCTPRAAAPGSSRGRATLARSAETEGSADPHIQHDLAGAASEVAGQQLLARRRVRIQQSIGGRNHAWLPGIGRDSGSAIE